MRRYCRRRPYSTAAGPHVDSNALRRAPDPPYVVPPPHRPDRPEHTNPDDGGEAKPV
jgi:hypothetical protein